MRLSDDPIHKSSQDLLSEYLSGERAKDYFVRVSSGTTRKLPRVLVRNHRAYNFGEEHFERPIIAFGSLNTKLVRVSNFLYYCRRGDSALVLHEDDQDSDLERLITNFKPDSVWGNPSFISRSLSHIRKKGLLSGIFTARLSGELLSKTTRRFIKKKLPNARIITDYGSSETATLGTTFLCPFQSTNSETHYHPLEGAVIDILNADTEGVGEILLTKKVDAVVFNRHRTGDLGRFIKKPCPCGNPVTFEVLGRKGFDFIRLVGATLHQKEFDRIANELRYHIRDYRIVASEDYKTGSLKGRIVMQVVPTQLLREKDNPAKFLKEQISSKIFLTPTRTLSDLVESNLFLPLQVELVREFSFQHKNIKIKRI